jgi:hypothetical protein
VKRVAYEVLEEGGEVGQVVRYAWWRVGDGGVPECWS